MENTFCINTHYMKNKHCLPYYPTQQAALLSKEHTLVLSHTICTNQAHHYL
jgi:hypothetical protein